MLHFDVAPKPGRDFPGRLLSHIPHHFCFCQPACRHHTYTHMYQQLAFPRWKRKLKAHNRYVGLRCKAAHSKPMLLPTLQPLHTPSSSSTSMLLITQPSVTLLVQASPYLQAGYLPKFIWKFKAKLIFLEQCYE